MNPLEGLAHYLDRLERRLRLFAWTRGAAAVVGAALLLTVIIVSALMMFAFSPNGLIFGRFVLFVGVGAAIAVGLIVPLMRMNRRRTAQEVEQRHPGFDQRLLTFTERAKTNASDPFLPLLAEDALIIARDAEPEQVVQKGRFIQFASLGAAAASVLVWLMFWGPGVFGYGTSLLWGSYPKDTASKSFYSITVQPGNKTVRRKSDVVISAKLSGFLASKANVFVQYASSAKWEEAPMQPESGGPGFGFMLPALSEDAQYYVEAGGLRSTTFKLHTIDLPAVKNIRVSYNYPSWTGLVAMTEDPGGDLRAVEGTVAKLEVRTDKALSNAKIVFEDGKTVDLASSSNNVTPATVTIEKDGSYHIAVVDHGELVRLTDDYFIEARKVGMPEVRITKPGRDAKVSPIEEVGITVTGQDEFPLQELDLHYSVNGNPEKVISMLKDKGAKQVEGSTLLSMEDFKLVPGDIVSLYATARDGKNTQKTDMIFVQAVPFEFEYSQSQESGGGAGGGGADDQQQQISEREKEIIAATFNQIKGDAKAKASAAENGKYLSDVQAKLRDQAQSLANRTKARQLDSNGSAFSQFVKEMELAVAAMSPASDKLKGLAFQDALTPEQQALQHLLRAESTFRQIQVQISRGGGGGGGGGGAGRDLANLFDLELDKDKNQYETNASSAAEQKQQQIDDALKKLQELARRQQELAQQQQNQQQLAQQRWQQEMLRREAEELKRQMEALQRGDQQQQGQQAQQSQQSQSGQQGQQSQQASSSGGQSSGGQQSQGQQSQQQQSARNQQQQNQSGQTPKPQSRQQAMNSQQLERAIKELEQATRDMSNSASASQQGQQNGQAQSEAQQAAERLKQAGQTLQSMRAQQNGSELGNIANQAEQLASQQQDFEDKLKKNFQRGGSNPTVAQQLVQDKQKMLDEYNQLQKDMQQTARDLSGTQPDASKKLRETMGRSQQEEIGNKMEWTQAALQQGMGQYAILHEAPVTQALNQLKDDLKKLESEAGQPGGGNAGDDKSKIAMQQALSQAERVRREIEQLGRARDERGQGGQQPGQKPGQQGQSQQPGGQQGGQQARQQGGQPGNQAGGQQQGGQQAGGQQQGGQQGGGQQAGNQQAGNQQAGGQQGGNQQNGFGSRAAGGPYGGGYGYNDGPRGDRNGPVNESWRVGDLSNQPPPANPDAAYSDLMRDIGRLRSAVGDDKDVSREIQDLTKRAQDLDPRHWNNEGQLNTVINGQALSEVDQLELVLRRKLQAGDSSVRSASPQTVAPGYADAVAEYNRRLSRQ